ncbi:MAG: hypothetical protein V4613_12440 [Bacteroidota bacterium]
MKIQFLKKIYLLIIFITASQLVKADAWHEPDWSSMLAHTGIVAKIEVITTVNNNSKVRIQKVYKGDVKSGDTIWISNFMKWRNWAEKGEMYLVFINHSLATKKDKEYWANQLFENPLLKEYVDALKNTNTYNTTDHTSSVLKIKGAKVRYDLTASDYYLNQSFYSLKAFEKFLNAYYYNKGKPALIQTLIRKITPATNHVIKAQYIMQLYLLKSIQYDEVFEQYIKVDNDVAKYALALHMGNINNIESKHILTTLLKDNSSRVQGEAVRQLARISPDTLGATLVSHIQTMHHCNFGPSSVMSASRNTDFGGRTQTIKTLGDIHYLPAIPVLTTMLDTINDRDFEVIITTLRQLGTKSYSEIIAKRLETSNAFLAEIMCRIIHDDSLINCLPSLMNYINKQDKTKRPIIAFAITPTIGLSYFNTDTVKRFLYNDFINTIKTRTTYGQAFDTKADWMEVYLQALTYLTINQAKPQLYEFMYDYYGYNSTFTKRPELLAYKKQCEDSIAVMIKMANIRKDITNIEVLAYVTLDNEHPVLKDYIVKIEYALTLSDSLIQKTKAVVNTKNITILRPHPVAEKFTVVTSEGREITNPALFLQFLEYIASVADSDDLAFLENLKKYNYSPGDYEYETIERYIIKVKQNHVPTDTK